MDIEVKSFYLERLICAIQRSKKIKSHADFYAWLQSSVSEFVPHDAILAVWGNFKETEGDLKLQYEVASSIDDFNSCNLNSASKEVTQCAMQLYQLWQDNHHHFYTVKNFGLSEFGCKFRMLFPDLPQQLNSLMVYGISDLRGGSDCLYIFFSKYAKFQIKTSALDLLMPHIDHVLRRVQRAESLTAASRSSVALNFSSLTERELEVVEWIKAGKTNQEIAAILNITQNTVKSHLKRVYQKLNVSKRAQAVALLANQ